MYAMSKAEDVFVSLKIAAVGFLFHVGPLCAWQLILRLREFEKKPHGHLHSGSTSLVEYCYVLVKFAQAPLRLDRIVIQLFVMLGHYLQVFLLLFLVQKEQSLSQAIFGIQNLPQTVSRNCFERKERDSCRRDPCTFTLVAPQHLSAIAVATLA